MFSLKKTQKLLCKRQFDFVFAKATKLATAEFTILYRKNEVDYARLGMALAKKRIAKSVQRNRLKRLLRETFRLHQFPGLDIVVLAKPGAATSDNKKIIFNLNKAWGKLADSLTN